MPNEEQIFENQEIYVCELYRLTLADGTQMFYTSGRFAREWDGNVYEPIPILRDSSDKKIDMSVEEIPVTVPYHEDYIDRSELEKGYFEGAKLEVVWLDYRNPSRYMYAFVGYAGEIDFGRESVNINFKNLMNLFRKSIPVEFYTETCRHRMYDEGCTLDINLHKVTGEADSGSDAKTIIDSVRTEDDEFFDLGIIEITSGNNAGEKRQVEKYITGEITVIEPFPELVVSGDDYELIPHCKKTYESCKNDFGNEVNFGGFQDIPNMGETLY